MASSYIPSAILVIVISFWLVKIARIALTGPLSKVPGPFLNKWTNIPLKLHILRGRRLHYVDALHKRYGPLVRISPTEISSSSPASNSQIHKIGSGHLKSSFYPDFTSPDGTNLGMFALIDPKRHAERRKLFARAFSQSVLTEWEDLLQDRTSFTVSRMKEEASRNGGITDILKWWTFMTSDVIGELGFGESFKSLERGEKSSYIRDLEHIMAASAIHYELPILHYLLRHLPIPPLQNFLQARSRLNTQGLETIRRTKARQAQGDNRKTLFTKILETAEKGETLTDQAVEREASGFIIAGSDTTGITLTYLIWAVLKHPVIKKTLLDELHSLHGDEVSIERVGKLEYLNLVVQETLRLYGAAPGGLPRVVPKNGGYYDGFWLPGGTEITTHGYTLHRNPEIYEKPEEFIPERWINASQAMKDNFMAFGGGTRVCQGIHLARMELSLGTVKFFRECPDAVIAPSQRDEDMEFENFFLIAPKGHKCEISIR